jgi:hypothetical protein
MSSTKRRVGLASVFVTIVALECVSMAGGCSRSERSDGGQRIAAPPARGATEGAPPVVTALGRIEALDIRVVTLEISPPAGQGIDVTFAAQQFERHKSDVLASDSRVDAAIVKVVHRVASGLLTVSRTESFVFVPDNRGRWRYTTEFDTRFSSLGL